MAVSRALLGIVGAHQRIRRRRPWFDGLEAMQCKCCGDERRHTRVFPDEDALAGLASRIPAGSIHSLVEFGKVTVPNLWGSNSRPRFTRLCGVVFVDESAEDGVAVDGRDVRFVGDRLRSGRAELLSAVWPLGVVVLDVLGHDRCQVTPAEDEHAVGEFGSDGADEPFRVAVRLRAPRRNLHDFDSGVGEDGVERGGELAGAVTHQDS